jgi:hypothetical protein
MRRRKASQAISSPPASASGNARPANLSLRAAVAVVRAYVSTMPATASSAAFPTGDHTLEEGLPRTSLRNAVALASAPQSRAANR